MVAYAKAHRLSVQAFYRAKARLMRYGAGQRPPCRSVFQRVEVVSGPVRLSSCRVHLPNGVVVVLPGGGGSGARPGAASGGRVVMMRAPSPICRWSISVARQSISARGCRPWRCWSRAN